MTAQEILSDAQLHKLLPSHLSGQTMQKTLQARIAEDIYRKRSNSAFYRTKLGTYFLRALADDPTLPAKALGEFDAFHRSRRIPKYRLLYASLDKEPGTPTILPYRYPLGETNTSYRNYGDDDGRLYSVSTMTFIMWESSILMHRDGKYSFFSQYGGDFSAGFRRYIDEFDVDLFIDDPIGADLSAQREYARIVGGATADESIEPRFVATRVDPASRSIVHAVMVRFGDNSEYSGTFIRRLDAPALHWAAVTSVLRYNLDPTSAALVPLLDRA